MDILFTNHLGCKISLTGRGALNKKDKEPLKSTLLFKIISGELLIILFLMCQLYLYKQCLFCQFKVLF